MDTYLETPHTLPIARRCDVLVVGGGPAGIAAAIAAARLGATTALVERFGYLGGTATASLMANINGFRNQVEPDATQTVRGIAEELILLLKTHNGLGRSPYPQKEFPTLPGALTYSYAIDTELFKYLTFKLAVEAGVALHLHTWFSQPVMDGSRVGGVIVEDKSGRRVILAKVVVDASGDGDVAARAGSPFWQTCKDEAIRLNDSLMYRISFGAQRPAHSYNVDFGAHAVVWGPGPGPIDATDADQLSAGEVTARLKIYEDFAARQSEIPELADAHVIETPPLLGIRQTRFIEGEYKLTADDALTGRRFADVVALSSCPVINYYGYRRYLEHQGFDIPYRCLVPLEVEGLLVAGRCISSEQVPYESFRAMAPIMAIGQAAGAAAVLSARNGIVPRSLDVSALQTVLRSQGQALDIS